MNRGDAEDEPMAVLLRIRRHPWQRLLFLHYDDELPVPQLARALHKPEPESRRILDEASHELRRRLEEAGCRFKVPDV